MKRLFLSILLCSVSLPVSAQQMNLVRILVASPAVDHELFQSVGDVVAGTLMRELLREGGIVLLDRDESERIIREGGGEGWVSNRTDAKAIGEAMDADVVIFSTIVRVNKIFKYTISFYQVKDDTVQRYLNGSFNITESPSGIGRIITGEAAKLMMYVPTPDELVDPGINLRVTMVDPHDLPSSHEIENIPRSTRFGSIEQVFSYYRVFPGDEQYMKLATGTAATRIHFEEEELDQELRDRYNMYNAYGDFAIQYDMQAFFIENCSTGAINLLVANNIPVFYNDDIIIGYSGLAPDGYCIFKTLYNDYFESSNMTHRNRLVVMFMVPQPGRIGGVSKDYLETAVEEFKDEWDKKPKLDEIKEGIFDITR